VVLADGVVLFAALDGQLHTYSATGTDLAQTSALGGFLVASPVVDSAGRVYVVVESTTPDITQTLHIVDASNPSSLTVLTNPGIVENFNRPNTLSPILGLDGEPFFGFQSVLRRYPGLSVRALADLPPRLRTGPA